MTATDAAPVRLAAGDPAPEFTLPDAEGNPVSLSDYRGRRVIVYCYPAALTPGCTTQAVDFTAAAGDLAEAGLDIIGISPDEPEKLLKFREKELELLGAQTAEKAAQYAAHTERLEQRVRVLEQIATDQGVHTAAQIEALREPRKIEGDKIQ